MEAKIAGVPGEFHARLYFIPQVSAAANPSKLENRCHSLKNP